MRLHSTRRLCTAIAASLALAACSGGGGDAEPDAGGVDPVDVDVDAGAAADGDTGDSNDGNGAPGSGLAWVPCDDLGIDGGPPVDCATLEVPLDHGRPDGETIEIAVARVDTAADGDQIGHLVFNPGGPGGSGRSLLEQLPFTIPADVQERFDLVSFDPRGVGASTALECDVEIDDNVSLLEAGDEAGWEALVAEGAEALSTCTADTMELAAWVGTNNAARDMDLLRAALGDDGLSYVGYSYGTRLGAVYAELFPDRVRALVLDAGVLPDGELAALDDGQAAGFDLALENFAAACDGDPDCLLRELGPTLEVIDGLRSELDEVGTFPAGDDRVLTRGEFDAGIIAALYSKDAWPFLAQALYLAETEQDGELLQVLGDNLAGREPDGTYDNSGVANGFINCADDPTRPTEEEVRANAEATASRSRYFGDALRASTGCLGLEPAADPVAYGPAIGAPPILVIGNTGDPATPFEWSEALADSLESGVLFAVEAEGHTAYGTIACVAEPVNAYLIDLEVPATPECSDNASADFFVPAADDEISIIVSLFACLRDNGADIPEVSAADLLADPTGEQIGEYLDPSDPTIAEAFDACTDELLALEASL